MVPSTFGSTVINIDKLKIGKCGNNFGCFSNIRGKNWETGICGNNFLMESKIIVDSLKVGRKIVRCNDDKTI